jgi:molybdopterin adenylyltransferase
VAKAAPSNDKPICGEKMNHHHHHHQKAASLKVSILVLSDKGSKGEREDLSGPALVKFVQENGVPSAHLFLLPDERDLIATHLRRLCDDEKIDVILTCGGTGVSPRDVTPEATRDVIVSEMPGFGEAMRAASMKKSPHAIVSRALAGIRGGTLIINLPGSPRAALENIEAVWQAVPHLVAKLQGDQEDCGVS